MKLRSGTPYWLLVDGLLATYPPLAADEACDVAVLGAGITGALLAHRLAADGVDVVVVDRRDAGLGSTVASTGLLQYETDTELADLAARVGEAVAVRCWRLGARAVDDLACLARELGDDCGFARRDSLYLASRARHARRLRREHDLRRRHGFDVELWDEAELARRSAFRASAALRSRGGGEVDAYRLTHRLLAGARARGARIYDRTTVTHARHAPAPRGTTWTLDTDRGTRLRARRLVLAAGYESGRFLPRPVGRLRSTFALASEPLPDAAFAGWPERLMVWESARPYFYLRATPDGRAIIGGLDARTAQEHRLPGLLARRTDRLAARLRELVPHPAVEPGYAWAGTFGETDDGMPYIGAHPDVPDAWFALGYGGNGITFGVVARRLIGDAHAGRANPDAELFAFGR